MTGAEFLVAAGGMYITMIVCAVRQAKRDVAAKVVRRREQRRHF